jgi:hypothetical protein
VALEEVVSSGFSGEEAHLHRHLVLSHPPSMWSFMGEMCRMIALHSFQNKVVMT